MKKLLWVLFAFFAILVGVFPFIFYALNIPFGITNKKNAVVLSDLFWKIGFHTHIIFAAIALSTGWIQFIPKFRNKYLKIHKRIGAIYLISALISSLASVFISFYATGGVIPIIGFALLGLIWFYTTLMGFFYVKCKEIELHQKMMIYSFAACFAGVTLRIWLPILVLIFNEYNTAYSIVAWLCWIPNMIVANIIIKKNEINSFDIFKIL